METFSASLALCVANSPVTGEFPSQRPVTRSCDAFFHLGMNKRLSKNRNDGDLRRHRDHYDVIVMRYLNVFTVEASIVMVIMFSLVNEQWIIPIMCLYVVHNRCCAHAWCHIFVNGIRR